jgi:hypothetical protein
MPLTPCAKTVATAFGTECFSTMAHRREGHDKGTTCRCANGWRRRVRQRMPQEKRAKTSGQSMNPKRALRIQTLAARRIMARGKSLQARLLQ